jgi:uncharacterized membrane protein
MTTLGPTHPTEPVAARTPPDALHRWVLPVRRPAPINPALLAHAKHRADYTQNRIADTITKFAGSMAFVYIHVLWFSCWIVLGVESYPYGLLTMIVSLEAIFLSTFVMISQNRADAKRQVIADQQWKTVQEEDEQNKKLIDLSEQILALTKETRDLASLARADSQQNQELLDVSRRTLDLTKKVFESTTASAARHGADPATPPGRVEPKQDQRP